MARRGFGRLVASFRTGVAGSRGLQPTLESAESQRRMSFEPTALPSVLLLDDGELDGVHRMLRRIGADVERLQGRAIGRSLPCPRDLLIGSVQRTLEAPDLERPAMRAQCANLTLVPDNNAR